MTKKGKIYVLFASMLFGGYAIYKIVAFASATPKDFEEARLRGAEISQEIVNISAQIKDDLAIVNELDKNWDYSGALTKISEVAKKTEDMRGKAVELSAELQIMTSALPKLGGEDAKQAVVESVSNRLALLSRLINYSDYTYRLVSVLREKFAGTWHSREEVAGLVEKINAEVTAVNSFNQSAMAAMDRFDKLQ
jgi:hypothetical protein